MLSCMIRMKTYRQCTVLWLWTFMVILSVGWWSIGGAQATCILVNTTDDALNSDGDCSLREAIEAANTDTMVDACMAGSGADNICVPEGEYTLTLGPLLMSSDIQLLGAGADQTIIQAADAPEVAEFRVCTIAGVVTISDVTIRHGSTVGDGGGIFISDSGSLVLTDSVVTQNTASLDGGGIRNLSSSLTLIRTVVTENLAASNNEQHNNGGGIFNGGGNAGGRLTLIDSIVSSNAAGLNGGGIYNNSGPDALTLINSQVSDNFTFFDGGGIENFSGIAALINSTLTGNMAAFGPDCHGDFISIGNTQIGDETNCNVTRH